MTGVTCGTGNPYTSGSYWLNTVKVLEPQEWIKDTNSSGGKRY